MRILTRNPVIYKNETYSLDGDYSDLDGKSPKAEILAFQTYANGQGSKLKPDGLWGQKTASAFSTYGAQWEKTLAPVTTSPTGAPAVIGIDPKTGKPTKKRYFGKEARAERKENRKSKHGSRPLKTIMKNGKTWFKDHLPKAKKKAKANGTVVYEYTPPSTPTVPNPVPVELKKEEVVIIPNAVDPNNPSVYAKIDMETPKEVQQIINKTTGEVVLTKEYQPDEVEMVVEPVNPDQPAGPTVESVYKKEDVIDQGAKDDKKPGMSKGLKIGLIVGGVVLLGAIIYFATRSKGTTAPAK